MAMAAAPILAVLALGAGAAETGLLSAAQSLPFLILSIPAGVLADRMRRRRLMVTAELLRAVALLLLPVLLAAGMLTLNLLALLGALIATGTVVYSVAAPALVPALVDRADFAVANTRLELARSLAFAAGPSLGGLLVSALGGGMAFVMAAVLSLAACVCMIGIPDPKRPITTRRPIIVDLRDGLSFVRSQPLLLAVMATSVVWSVSWFVLNAIWVLFAVRRLGLDGTGVGLTLGALGCGMLGSAVVAPMVMRMVPVGRFITFGPVFSLLGMCLLAGSEVRPGLILPILGFFSFGFGITSWTIGNTTLRQALTPPALLGRVSALFMVVSYGARPIGAAIGGLVGEVFGLEAAIALAVFGFAVQAVIVLTSPIPRLRKLPEQAA
jgi:predicted MFS family arabinose efflux permease